MDFQVPGIKDQKDMARMERNSKRRVISSPKPMKVATKVNIAKEITELSTQKIEDAQSVEVPNTKQERVTDQRSKIHHHLSEIH